MHILTGDQGTFQHPPPSPIQNDIPALLVKVHHLLKVQNIITLWKHINVDETALQHKMISSR